jgi:hypothetical protein
LLIVAAVIALAGTASAEMKQKGVAIEMPVLSLPDPLDGTLPGYIDGNVEMLRALKKVKKTCEPESGADGIFCAAFIGILTQISMMHSATNPLLLRVHEKTFPCN